MSASLSTIARRFSFVREVGGANVGAWVTFFQRWCGGTPGDSWCCDFASLVEDVAYEGKAPTKRTGSCQEKLDDARKKGYVVQAPAIDDLYFYVNDAGHAHHIGIVSNVSPLSGIAGNTSSDGVSSNGDGVYEHALNVSAPHIIFVRLP
jgi:hypothetical protein